MTNTAIIETPWDKKVFGINTFEVLDYTEETLHQTQQSGLYTLKLDPLSHKELAQQFGFYYCDTLITPECKPEQLQVFENDVFTFDCDTDIQEMLKICDCAFSHGRFHRDFNLSKKDADARYNQWLLDIFAKGSVFALRYQGNLGGFIAVYQNELQLHAISEKFRGRGYAKYWWSNVCQHLFLNGQDVIKSSVSSSNLPVVNLYASLGFKFVKAVDVYHKFVR